MRQSLLRYGRQIFHGLNEDQIQNQLQITTSELAALLPYFEGFFTNVDDSERPPQETMLDFILNSFNTGEWLFVKQKEANYITGLVYLNYGRPGRDALLTVFPIATHFDLSVIVNYVFGLKKFNPGYQYIKIKTKQPNNHQHDYRIFTNAGFVAVGASNADVLLQGKLYASIMYECFHPDWGKPAGQELVEDEDLIDDANIRRRTDDSDSALQPSSPELREPAVGSTGIHGATDSGDERSDAKLATNKPKLGRPPRANGAATVHAEHGSAGSSSTSKPRQRRRRR
jgi:hypothetical protein